MNTSDMVLIVVISILCVASPFICVALCAAIRVASSGINDYIRARCEYNKTLERMANVAYHEAQVKYTASVLNEFKEFIAEYSAMKYNNFKDSVVIEKVTLTKLKYFISETSRELITMLSIEVDFDNVLFTEEYLEKYIANTSVIMLKKLFERDAWDIADQL